MPEETQTISFRVPASLARRLEADGAKDDLSRNEYARRLVLATLDGPSAQDVLGEIVEARQNLAQMEARLSASMERLAGSVDQALHNRSSAVQTAKPDLGPISQQILELHESLATGVAALLVEAGNVSPNDAKAWVSANLFRSGST